jgi:hypothetical protein
MTESKEMGEVGLDGCGGSRAGGVWEWVYGVGLDACRKSGAVGCSVQEEPITAL